ncbi:MAG: CbiX/SirB N-terminal domain-containing protein [Desulfobacter sp.]|nr:CbiX/SirB N-terminal domain-containing protein [Desulfobacter sp.]WDP87389.1 MAG: CbiX/SirB N-terminal domain-containing protein [Desulfobacter sp.]
MKVLVVAAHGSRKKESVAEVAAFVEKLAAKASPLFDRVVHGFLQFSDPLLPEVIETQVSCGASQIVVFPFFISAGSHILNDMPELVNAVAQAYPEVDFCLTRHLGAMASVEDLILDEMVSYLDKGTAK